jgi:hypothetical protein
MARELSDESVRHEAEQFLAYAEKQDVGVKVGAFCEWAAGKDFGPADLLAIVKALRESGRYV